MTETKRDPMVAAAIAFVAAVYLACAMWMPSDGTWIYDNAVKILQVRAIHETGRFSLDWPGRSIDPQLEFFPPGFYGLKDDALYSAYSPLFPLLATPCVALFGPGGLLALPIFGALLTLIGVARLARKVSTSQEVAGATALVAVATVAFATPLWFYALVFWEHTLAAGVSCFAVIACIEFTERPDSKRALLLGALVALPVWFRPENYLFAFVVLAYAGHRVRSLRQAHWLVLGGLAAMLPLWGFHAFSVGNPLGLHIAAQTWEEISLAAFLSTRGIVLQRMLFNWHGVMALSLAAGAPYLLAIGLRLVKRTGFEEMGTWAAVAAAIAVAAASVVGWGYAYADSPISWLIVANGLFAASPLLIFAFLPGNASLPAPITHARTALLTVSLAFAALYTAFIPEMNSRGAHWGNRFLFCLYPLLGVLAAAAIVEARSFLAERASSAFKAFATSLIALAAIASIALQVYSLVLLESRKGFVAELNREVSQRSNFVVASDRWVIPVDLANVWFEKATFWVPPRRREAFMNRLREAGVESVLFVDNPQRAKGDLLDDGWLHFSPVALREERVAPPPE